MKAFFIILIIIAVLFLICMVKIKIDVTYKDDNGVQVVLKLIFFKFRLFPLKGKKVKKQKRKEICKEEKKPSDETYNKVQHKQKHDFIKLLEMIKIFLDPIPNFLRSLNRGLTINNLRVIWCISKEDAGQTAIIYGRSCAIFYSVLGIVDSFMHVKIDRIRIYPDFINEHSYCNVFFRLQMRIGKLVTSSLKYFASVLIDFIKKNFKKI